MIFQILGKVLPNHARLLPDDRDAHFLCHPGRKRRQSRGIDQRPALPFIADLCRAAVCRSHGFRRLPDQLLAQISFFIRHGPDRAFNLGRPRDHIPGIARARPGHGQHAGRKGADTPADHLLKRQDQRGHSRHRVDAVVRLRAVPAFSFNRHAEPVRARHDRIFPDAQRAGFNIRVRMQAVILLHVIQKACTQHRQCPVIDFFARLEDQADRALQFCFPLFEKRSSTEERSGMEVMPAGMHFPRSF